MPDPFAWPAFQSAGDLRHLPERLSYERAVWGKLHGSASDYRWIAASPGFDPGRERLEEAIPLGPEERPPEAFPVWRTLAPGYLAVLCAPGHAADAAGRKTPLVKQVLRWQRPETVPAALGALLLLHHAETFDDTLWLDLETPGASELVPLDPETESPPVVTAEGLETLAEEGIEDLRKSVSPGGLATFYAAILDGVRPAVLSTIGRPLSPQALAALLLPFDPERAGALSLAGWIPSRRARRKRLAPVWDGVAVSGASASRLRDPEARKPTPEIERRATRMAEALLKADPAALAATETRPARRGPGASAIEQDGEAPIQLAMWGPSSAGKTILLARLACAAWTDAGPWKVWPTEELLAYAASMRDQIDKDNRFPPPTGAEPERIAFRFERRPDGLRAVLTLEDRAGFQWEQLQEEVQRTLDSADGLLMMIDPLRDPAHRDIEVRNTLDRLAASRDGRPDERPLAICLSKADVLMESPEDLRLAREEPDRFVKSRLSKEIVAILDQYHADYRLFPVSAVGVRLHWGVVEPAVFFDEDPSPRIHPGAEPVHLVTPFAWLLDRAAARRDEGRP